MRRRKEKLRNRKEIAIDCMMEGKKERNEERMTESRNEVY
jgi:hypothetical protein